MHNEKINGISKSTTCGFWAASALPDPLAAAACSWTYARGGNAADAAVAAAFALAVVEPDMSGLGGQAHIVVRDGRTGQIEAIDAYSIAPSEANESMFEWEGSSTQGEFLFKTVGDKNTNGHLSIAVPGALLGWNYVHKKYGTLPLDVLLEPAIGYAEQGFPVNRRLAVAIQDNLDRISGFPESRELLLDTYGKPKTEGSWLKQSALARTLKLIARNGVSVFYEGEVARSLVREMEKGGGIIRIDDLGNALRNLLRVVPPVEGKYRGASFFSAPPPSAGGGMLSRILAVLDKFDMVQLEEQGVCALAEVFRLSFAKRAEVFGQPTVGPETISAFCSEQAVAAEVAEVTRRLKGLQSGDVIVRRVVQEEQTTHHSHMDSNGTCVALTQSLGSQFGSCVMVPEYGIFLNNAMKLFDARPGKPNCIAPGRKMLSSMSPTIVMKDGQPRLVLGSPMGTRIISAVAQVIVNVYGRGLPLWEAISRPRIDFSTGELMAEDNLDENEKEALRQA
ncbi:MAG: gamma-glutamyltransferase, partial [Chloroflexota bacterium]